MTNLLDLSLIRGHLAPKQPLGAMACYRILERDAKLARFFLSAAGAMLGFVFAMAVFFLTE